eukprot:COSAG01_NODE_1174_length_11380_cov_2.922205_1_plen_181_part_00
MAGRPALPEAPAAMAPWPGRRLLAATAAAAAALLRTPSAVEALCFAHSDCPGGQYCDMSMMCYSCTYVNHSSCDAIDHDCCGRAFLQNCPSDPAGCPPAPAGSQCDLSSCTCDGVSLSELKSMGAVWIPPDSEGYSYKISFCDTIANIDLPSGCQQYAEAPAVVKYKWSNPADCREVSER